MRNARLALLSAVTVLCTWPALAVSASRPVEASAGAGVLDPARQKALYLGVIESLRNDGKAHAALAHLDSFDLAYPRDPSAQILRAGCLTDVADYDAAEALYRKLSTGPAADQAQAGLGRVYGQRGDWPAAAAAFALAVKKRPAYAPYLNDLGFALMKAGRSDDGLFRLRQAVELAPADPLIRNNLILALDQSGHAAEAAQQIAAIASPDERGQAQAVIEAARADAEAVKPKGELAWSAP